MKRIIPQPGKSLGNYVIREEIGFGTSGYVYLAHHQSSGKAVAIKLLRPENLVDPGHLARFERELDICYKLSHPNIVQLLETGELEDESLYAVFEYIHGDTLQDLLIKESKLSLKETCQLMTGVLDGLLSAHESGIVHRDIKPSNIIISKSGILRNAHILDFGLGGIVDGHESNWQKLTHAGEYMGTPLYSPREQWEGLEAAKPEWDIFGWAIVFLECLLGEHPSGGELPSAGTIRIPEYLELHPLGALLAKATHKDPGERDITPEDLIGALSSAAHELKDSEEADKSGEGRRRFVTVLAAQFITPVDPEVDPEEISKAIKDVIEICQREARHSHGTLVSNVGESALMVFGHPRVHEDDAKRAAQCGLRILRKIDEFNANSNLHIGIKLGMNSGPAFSTGVGEQEHLELIGATFDMASRLDAAADEGDFIVSNISNKLLQGQFDLLKTIKVGSQEAYLIAEPSSERTNQEQNEGSPFIGRTMDMAQLEDAWSRATHGQAQSRLVVGEAGIGKSRILHELKGRAGNPNWLETRCLKEKQSNPMEPIIELLTTTFKEKLDSLDLEEILSPEQRKLLDNLLTGQLPTHDLPLTTQKARELTMDVFVSLAVALCEEEPTVFLIEDLHWADPSTLELISYFEIEIEASAAQGDPLPLLLICTSRQPVELKIPVINISRLSKEEMKELIDSRIPEQRKPNKEWVDSVIEKGDGIPLFIEEVAKLMEHQDQEGSASKSVRIPVTLAELLNERIDSISSSALTVAQYAAALGRQFSFNHLCLSSGFTTAVLQKHLDSLTAAGLIYTRRSGAERKYIFKHALLRDAVYDSMLKKTRVKVHSNIVKVLLAESADGKYTQPANIASHLRESGNYIDSCSWSRKAADQAFVKAAYLESMTILTEALAILDKIEDEDLRLSAELSLLEAMGPAQFSTMGLNAPAVHETYLRAKELCGLLGEDVSLSVLGGLWIHEINEGNPDSTAECLQQFRSKAEKLDEPIAYLTVDVATATYLFYRGELKDCKKYCEKSIQQYQDPGIQEQLRKETNDMLIHAFCYRQNCLYHAGELTRARDAVVENMERARSTGNPYHLHNALAYCMCLQRELGNVEETLAMAQEEIVHCQEQSMLGQVGTALCTLGWARVFSGDADGRQDIINGLETMKTVGMKVSRAYQLMALIEVDLKLGNIDSALSASDEGIEHCGNTIEYVYLSYLYGLRSTAKMLSGQEEAAAQDFAMAMQSSRAIDSTMLQLRNMTNWLTCKGDVSDEERKELKKLYESIDRSNHFPILDPTVAILG